jgi:2-oxoglutarate dehydrogenase E2 component (dihydrolipoamide succinyltransferase)
MATNVVMPQMGESIAEGTIVRWIKKLGDAVDRDEPLFEISTDKVDAEIPSPAAGVLTDIKVKEGETVPVNSVVAVIGVRSGLGTSGEAGATRRRGSPRCGGQCARCCACPRDAGARRQRPRRERGGSLEGRAAASEVVAARAAHRAGTQRRHP